ncbi:lysophospholipid acyltransferase family protein [Rhodococcus sp. B50]|uniref:lysophospholipid acyltransferase family protein n=1 Tax=Rhodococcus sp. B50 TaxID=2682847 RepID=UPI001BD3416A|nr:lysophospholipid acyltransferase family protein [Rhodococcus sp. B50]MBS9371459.1 hypothetical protein [Rhodococcus sp. B50]
MTRLHEWMPSSPCGARCLPDDADRVGLPAVWLRIAIVALVLTVVPLLLAGRVIPAARREGALRRSARVLLWCVGMRLSVDDRRDRRAHAGGVLVVAPHVSWTDVLVLTAVAPAAFVARADLLDWGAWGALARRMRVIAIERERLRLLPDVIDRIRTRLLAGERVAVFPEGTTWCGRAYGGFRPALLQAAVDAECPVQPVGLRYSDQAGESTAVPAFVGDETIGSSIRRMIRSRRVVAEVVLAPLEWPGQDRRDLAARCDRAVRAERVADAISSLPVDLSPATGAAPTADVA